MTNGPDYIGFLQWPGGFVDICRRRSEKAAREYVEKKIDGWPLVPRNACVCVRRFDVKPPNVERRNDILVPALHGLMGSKEVVKMGNAGFFAGARGRSALNQILKNGPKGLPGQTEKRKIDAIQRID